MHFLLSECFRKRRASSIALLLILAGTLLTFWPGMLMSDTSSRWTAVLILNGTLKVGWLVDQWLAPTMTLFMMPFGSTGSFPLFTVVQIAYLALAGLMWIALTSSKRPLWVPLLFVLPVIFSYASFLVPDVWTLAAMVVVIAILNSDQQRLGKLALLLFFVSNVVLFGFRQNSLVLLPFVAFLVIKRVSDARWERYILLSLMALAMILIVTVPKHIGFTKRTSTAAAPAWELVGMLRVAQELNMPVDPGITLEGITDTKAAIRTHSFATIDPLLWGEGAPVSSDIILHHSAELKSRWFKAVRTYPGLYVRTKLRIYECTIGLCDQYFQIVVAPEEPSPLLGGHVKGYVKKAGLGGTILDASAWLEQRAKFLFLPVFWVPVGCLVFLMQWRRYSPFDRLLIVGATIYLLSFFLLNQAATFRYMLPVYAVYTAYQIRYIGWLFGSLGSTSKLAGARPGQ